MGKLEGRVAVVTGGARGIGAACVRALAAEGAAVAVCDVLEDEGGALAAELPGAGVRFVTLDVRDETAWARAAEEVERELGAASVLVNNAGVLAVAPLAEMELAEWQRVIDTNLTGTFLGMRTFAPQIRRAGGGAIVNMSSMAAYVAVAPASAYTASKWAIRGLTKAAALELGPDIRVNSVHPGMIRTPMTEGGTDEAAQSASYPLPRFGRPEEVAAMVRAIVCDAPYSTGSEFCVDGGILAGIAVGE